MQMSLTQDLWQANQDLAQTCLTHPFVQGIATGKLPQDRFAYYIGQDTFFLEAFARAYCIAAAKASDWPTFQRLHHLAGEILRELRLHESYAAEWGINLRNIQAGKATRCYTDFLLATAWSCDVSLTALAMTPCLRLYAFLGQHLAKRGIPNHRYSTWIKTYSSSDFEALALQLEQLVEQQARLQDISEHRIQQTYRYAMLCERDFFEAAWDPFTR
jgi:thiaminase/transcriptional activator TenA